MNCQGDILALTESKFHAASTLFINGFHDDAYYIAGYTIELLLKPRVCKMLDIDNLFDETGKYE